MAKDITIRVTGQNQDGTLNVQQVDGANPFMSQSSTAMVPAGTQAMTAQAQAQTGYRARIGNVEVMFATEADYLKADRAMREMTEQQNVPMVGGLGGRGSTLNWLRTGANAADAVAGFLNGRNIRRKLDDLDDALAESRDARAELDNLERTQPTLAPLIPVLRRLFLAEPHYVQIDLPQGENLSLADKKRLRGDLDAPERLQRECAALLASAV